MDYLETYSTSVEAENSLIRHGIIYPGDTIPLVNVLPEDFQESRNKKLWQCILNIYDESRAERIDSIALSDASGVPASYIQDILNTKTVGKDPTKWSDFVIKDSAKRRYMSILEFAQDSELENPFHEIEQTITALGNISDRTNRQVSDAKSLMMDTLRDIENVAEGKQEAGVDVGLEAIRNCSAGIPLGVITVVGADASVGKTAFMLDMLTGAARNGTVADFYTLEDEKTNIGRRIIAKFSEVNLKSIRMGKLSGDEWISVSSGTSLAAELPYNVYDKFYSNVEAMCYAIARNCRENGTRIVFVDYLQLLRSKKNFKSRNDELDYVLACFKKLAKDYKIALVIGSQLRRRYQGEDDRPTKAMLRDSGSVEQHAHVIFMLYRKRLESVTELLVEKNKDGPAPVTHYLNFAAACAAFKDCTTDEISDYLRKYTKSRSSAPSTGNW